MIVGDLFNGMSDKDGLVLIEFTCTGGPYHSPGDIHFIAGTNNIAFDADFPRNDVLMNSMADALLSHVPEGEVQLFHPRSCRCGVVGPGDSWYQLKSIRIHQRGIVLVAGGLIST